MKLLSMAVTLPIAAVLAALAVAPATLEDAAKCGRSERAEPHYVINGQLHDMEPGDSDVFARFGIMRTDVHELQVLCLDPEKRVLKTGTGEPVLYLTTTAFMAALPDDVGQLVAAQDEYRAEHGRFAGTPGDLGVQLATPGLEVSLTVSANGWHATAGSGLLVVACHVFAGSITPPQEDLTEREPACRTLPQFQR